jgi:hypothetical protein
MASAMYACPLDKFEYKISNNIIYIHENSCDIYLSSYSLAKFGYHIHDNIIYIYEKDKYYLFDSDDKQLMIQFINSSSSCINNSPPNFNTNNLNNISSGKLKRKYEGNIISEEYNLEDEDEEI